MTRDEIINELIREMMYEDEFLEYIEALTAATNIYENMFKDEEGGI